MSKSMREIFKKSVGSKKWGIYKILESGKTEEFPISSYDEKQKADKAVGLKKRLYPRCNFVVKEIG